MGCTNQYYIVGLLFLYPNYTYRNSLMLLKAMGHSVSCDWNPFWTAWAPLEILFHFYNWICLCLLIMLGEFLGASIFPATYLIIWLLSISSNWIFVHMAADHWVLSFWEYNIIIHVVMFSRTHYLFFNPWEDWPIITSYHIHFLLAKNRSAAQYPSKSGRGEKLWRFAGQKSHCHGAFLSSSAHFQRPKN